MTICAKSQKIQDSYRTGTHCENIAHNSTHPSSGAFKRVEGDAQEAIRVSPADPAKLSIVASRDHAGPQVKELLERFRGAETKSMGSSLKLCLVAEGKADLYPRFAPTSEWDTAAAQAVVEAAGGRVVDTGLMPLRYNTKESLLNPFFYVIGDKTFPWNDILSGITP